MSSVSRTTRIFGSQPVPLGSSVLGSAVTLDSSSSLPESRNVTATDFGASAVDPTGNRIVYVPSYWLTDGDWVLAVDPHSSSTQIVAAGGGEPDGIATTSTT